MNWLHKAPVGALRDIQERLMPVRQFQTEGSAKASSDRTYAVALLRRRLSLYVGEIDATSCLNECYRGRSTQIYRKPKVPRLGREGSSLRRARGSNCSTVGSEARRYELSPILLKPIAGPLSPFAPMRRLNIDVLLI